MKKTRDHKRLTKDILGIGGTTLVSVILELSGINKTYLDYREENLLVEGLRGLEGRRDHAGTTQGPRRGWGWRGSFSPPLLLAD